MNFNNQPETFSEKSYSEILESAQLEKMYTIEDGIFKCSIITYYRMEGPSYDLYNKFNINIELVQHESIDSLIEDFLKNENALITLNDAITSSISPATIKSYKILKIQKITIFKSNNPENAPFLTTEQQISSEVFMKGDEFIERVCSHPKFNEYQTRAIEIAEENERIAIQADKERKSNVLKNNYEMWKALNAKKEAGEFNEFLG
jgi:hypothetical protein